MPDTSLSNNSELTQLIDHYTKQKNQFITDIPGLTLYRCEVASQYISLVLDASLCLIAQGQKQVILGKEIYNYDSNHFLFTAVDLPIISKIVEASVEQPCFTLVLRLDPYVLTQIILDSDLAFKHEDNKKKGIAVGVLSSELNDAFIRLLKLLDNPEDIPVLSPLIIKEIFYRLLISPQGERLKSIVAAGTTGHRIVKAIEWIKSNPMKSFRVEELANTVGMSVSSFHKHFQDITSMSPLQYQKRIKLSEARRLLIAENLDITSTSLHVGYESASQFSREYKRFFGVSPSADIKKL
jgi:AraC-like DNA-binding protein